jgi:hypothetical protein
MAPSAYEFEAQKPSAILQAEIFWKRFALLHPFHPPQTFVGCSRRSTQPTLEAILFVLLTVKLGAHPLDTPRRTATHREKATPANTKKPYIAVLPIRCVDRDP